MSQKGERSTRRWKGVAGGRKTDTRAVATMDATLVPRRKAQPQAGFHMPWHVCPHVGCPVDHGDSWPTPGANRLFRKVKVSFFGWQHQGKDLMRTALQDLSLL